jgi:nucleoside-diphosphate-sugar epimerase
LVNFLPDISADDLAGSNSAARFVQVQETGSQRRAQGSGANSILMRIAPSYGPLQSPDEPVAQFITQALTGQAVVVPKRDKARHGFVFVDDVADAIARVLWKGEPGRTYEAAGADRLSFSDVAALVRKLTAEKTKMTVKDANLAYAPAEFPDLQSLRQLGWEPRHSLVDGLQKTIDWYRRNPSWWRTP